MKAVDLIVQLLWSLAIRSEVGRAAFVLGMAPENNVGRGPGQAIIHKHKVKGKWESEVAAFQRKITSKLELVRGEANRRAARYGFPSCPLSGFFGPMYGCSEGWGTLATVVSVSIEINGLGGTGLDSCVIQ